jgi:phosphatidate cytidylyltransferase
VSAREYRTRIGMGLVMVLLASGVLVVDQYLAPWYPCLLVTLLVLGALATAELHQLLGALPRPPLGLAVLSVWAVVLASWPAHLGWTADSWRDLAVANAGVVVVAFLWEMAHFRAPGGAVVRLALLTWMVGYLGLLPAFLAQLRWWPPLAEGSGAELRGVTALALPIFVPKGGDIGAYFTGRLLGRHRMTPRLSPKKTWEGLLGGLATSALVAMALNAVLAPLLSGAGEAAVFGVVVGGAGVLGDLAESLIKRDSSQKDASNVVPGFGGVLDVVDSILFAAPVAYLWLHG